MRYKTEGTATITFEIEGLNVSTFDELEQAVEKYIRENLIFRQTSPGRIDAVVTEANVDRLDNWNRED